MTGIITSGNGKRTKPMKWAFAIIEFFLSLGKSVLERGWRRWVAIGLAVLVLLVFAWREGALTSAYHGLTSSVGRIFIEKEFVQPDYSWVVPTSSNTFDVRYGRGDPGFPADGVWHVKLDDAPSVSIDGKGMYSVPANTHFVKFFYSCKNDDGDQIVSQYLHYAGPAITPEERRVHFPGTTR